MSDRPPVRRSQQPPARRGAGMLAGWIAGGILISLFVLLVKFSLWLGGGGGVASLVVTFAIVIIISAVLRKRR